MVADRLLSSASKTMNPKTIFRGLYYYVFGSIKRLLVSLVFLMGYLTVFTFGIMSVLKLFFPHHVGFFLSHDGFPIVGITGNPEDIKTDVFGYWIIPIGIAVALLLYLTLTRRLSILKKIKKK